MKRTIMMTVEAGEDDPIEEMVEEYLHSKGIEVVEPDDDDEDW